MSSGMALVFIPLTSTSLHGVSNHDTGVASAMINTSQQVGGSLGTALLNTVAATAATSYVIANDKEVAVADLSITPADVAEIVALVNKGELTDKLARQVVEGVVVH